MIRNENNLKIGHSILALSGVAGICLALFFPASIFVQSGALVLGLVSGYANRQALIGYVIVASIPFTAHTIGGIPLPFPLLMCILLGALARGILPRATTLDLIIIGAIVLNLIARPPVTDSGWVAAFAIVYLVAARVVIRTPASNRAADHAWITGTLVVTAGIALVQVYGNLGSAYADYENVRIFESVLGSSNSAAWKATVVGIMALAIAFAPSTGAPTRLLWALASALFLAAPLVLASRGSILAGGFGLLLLGYQLRRRRTFLFSLAGGLVALIATSSIAAQQRWFVWRRLAEFDTTSTDYTSGRTDLWMAAARILSEHPVLGVGLGRVTDQLLPWYRQAYVHNLPLEILAQLGLVVGTLFLVALVPPIEFANPYLPAIGTTFLVSLLEPSVATPVGAVFYGALLLAYLSASQAALRQE